ncbi:hypothetical protein [Psychrobacter sp. DAB_AL62B]|uniref:hypothetical protein n=1 Tax=Psychrobacter sp. DAB_AL62B TaxID=1028420 RepID=UPI00238103E9|nr:hypothetical protein [Psychrobacter sp. DAB_AL62B]MDE4454157.1 hypothetical protein [Psychrobacter sp. DAB_AL62B]
MSIDDKKPADTSKVTVDAVREWLIQTTRLFAKFAIILLILGGALLLSFALHLPIYVSYSLVLLIAAVLFIMLIMVSIKNIVYLYLKTSIWGQIVLYLLVALISAHAYLYAIGEVNRIFLVDPSNLALTTSVLTGIVFFKYAIMALLGSYLIAIGLYFYIKQTDKSAVNNRQPLGKKMLTGIAFVFITSISLVTAGHISKYSDALIKAFALKIDFYSHYTCTGDDFRDVEGVLFLSASDILVAKKVDSMEWKFKNVKCEP